MSKKAKKGKPAPKKIKFKYPPDKEILEFEIGLRNIVFKKTLTDHVLTANKAVVAGIDFITPHVDTLYLHTESIEISEALSREAYPQWDEMPAEMKNKILKQREKAKKLDLESLSSLMELVNIQARQTLNWDDRLFQKIEELQQHLKLVA